MTDKYIDREIKITVPIVFSIKIPKNSNESWPSRLQSWLNAYVAPCAYNCVDERFEERLVEFHNEDFEPEIEDLSELGEYKLEIGAPTLQKIEQPE